MAVVTHRRASRKTPRHPPALVGACSFLRLSSFFVLSFAFVFFCSPPLPWRVWHSLSVCVVGRLPPGTDRYSFKVQCAPRIEKLLANDSSWQPPHVSSTTMGYKLSHHGPDDHISQIAKDGGCYRCSLNDLLEQVKMKHSSERVTFFEIGTTHSLLITDSVGVKVMHLRPLVTVVANTGANIGTEMAKAAMSGDAVWAFEPLPPNVERLCETIWLNDWQENVRVFPFAVGDHDVNDEPMCFSSSNSGASAVGYPCNQDQEQNTYHVRTLATPLVGGCSC